MSLSDCASPGTHLSPRIRLVRVCVCVCVSSTQAAAAPALEESMLRVLRGEAGRGAASALRARSAFLQLTLLFCLLASPILPAAGSRKGTSRGDSRGRLAEARQAGLAGSPAGRAWARLGSPSRGRA